MVMTVSREYMYIVRGGLEYKKKVWKISSFDTEHMSYK